MKVAIIGAGVSGLSCAYRLNQLGVRPVIFERRPIIGESVNLLGVHLNCFNHLFRNPLHFFEKKYALNIKPLTEVRRLVMIAQDREVAVTGRLGHIFNRGSARTSLEYQLFSQIEAELYMDTYIFDSMVEDVAKQFDSVVVATGRTDIPDYFGLSAESTIIAIRSGIMDGKYEQGKVISWVKTDYSRNLFIYLVPSSERKATITLMVDNISMNDLDLYWRKTVTTEAIANNFLETWDSEYYSCRLRKNRLGNIYFIGTAGGMTDDYFGFGIINAIAGGFFAAEAIAQGKSFERSIKPIITQVDQLHNLRLMANKMDSKTWKRLITIMGMPGISHAVYKHSLVKFHHFGALAGFFMKSDNR